MLNIMLTLECVYLSWQSACKIFTSCWDDSYANSIEVYCTCI